MSQQENLKRKNESIINRIIDKINYNNDKTRKIIIQKLPGTNVKKRTIAVQMKILDIQYYGS